MELHKILFLPTANAGVTYWRMWNFANSMHRCGHAQAHIQWYNTKGNDLAEWEYHLQQARNADDYAAQYAITKEIDIWMRQSDAIVVGLCHGNASLDVFMAMLDARNAGHLRDTPILMEIDDNILSVPTQNPAFNSYEPGTPIRDMAIRQMKAADGLVVSTPFLAEIYSEFNQNIYVIPNSIDFAHWGRARNKPKPGIRIGWAGGSAHREDLALLETVIPEILHRHENVVFSFFHGNAPFLFALEKQHPGRVEVVKQWSDIDHYPEKIAAQDWNIALAPLIDSSFNRAKSNLRWLEAGALGIPCVASDVGHFADTIEHGRDGMLCEGPEDFVKNLSALIENKKLRKTIGANAKQRIQRDFNADTTGKEYLDALIDCGNKVADRKVDAAIEDLKIREASNDEGTTEDANGVPCGRPATDAVRGLLQ